MYQVKIIQISSIFSLTSFHVPCRLYPLKCFSLQDVIDGADAVVGSLVEGVLDHVTDALGIPDTSMAGNETTQLCIAVHHSELHAKAAAGILHSYVCDNILQCISFIQTQLVLLNLLTYLSYVRPTCMM